MAVQDPKKPKDPKAPKPSDKPKPDNNNQLSYLLGQRLKFFVDSITSDIKEVTIYHLWNDLVRDFLLESFETLDHVDQFLNIPKLFVKCKTDVMKKEFLNNLDKLTNLMCSACWPPKDHQISSHQIPMEKNEKREQIIQLNTTINLPQGLIKSDPMEIRFDQSDNDL